MRGVYCGDERVGREGCGVVAWLAGRAAVMSARAAARSESEGAGSMSVGF